MAVKKVIRAVDMKTILNFGEEGGRIVKKTKTYGDLRTDVTDEAFVTTAEAIAKMQEPIMEKKEKIVSEELMRTGE
ncbi:hypothetical protein [Eubacterium sp. 1001713B170207_170306_E7]|uniref:DUF1659 domain-containing protein n=1 Tax=Eubacterium sp. 1001713B170207_170306_E7 TaxID=2787097 RepID=UPI0018970035|nr:hypothetical protein [Eubacterium sp. 1001713B170207_170306_E7]